MNKYIKILFCASLLLVNFVAIAQSEQVIRGTVKDNKGNPMSKVTVYEIDVTSNGTTSDDKGQFTLRLMGKRHILVFSHSGFLQQEVSASTNGMAIVLQDDIKGMDEVVILGFGQKVKKLTNTGSVSSITGDQIRQSPSASLQNSLAGRLPGLFSLQRSGQPGRDGANLLIRGVSTYAGTTSPLIIVDDIEFSLTQLNQIDPNEVESLSILKDASTTAVYGVRGANGVIVVKTRRGKSGKAQITVRNETGLYFPTQRPKVNDGYTTLKLWREFLSGGSGNGNFIDPATSSIALVNGKNVFAGNNLERFRLNDDPDNYPNVNWWDVLMQKYSMQNRVNFDISGGTEKVKYFVSLGYISQDGIFKNFSKDEGYNTNYFYNRYNFRSNLDLDPTKSLHIRMDLSGRFGVVNEPNDASWNNGGRTFQYLWNGELSGFNHPVNYSNGLLAGPVNYLTLKPNPVANFRYAGYNRAYDNDMNFVTQAVQKLDVITKGLSANVLVSYASNYGFSRSLTRNRDEILVYTKNAAGQYVPTVNNLFRMGKLTRGGGASGTNRLLNIQTSLNYGRSFGKHSVSATALLNQTNRIDDSYGSTTDGEPEKNRGIVGVVGYDYKQKYLLNVNGSYNGTDKFLGSKKYGFFPAVSAGWVLSEESFFKNTIPFVNFFKIRGSYGVVGNDNIGTSIFSVDKVYGAGSGRTYYFGDNSVATQGMVEPSLSNYEITWEKQKEWGVGVELKFLNGRLSLIGDYFKKFRYDIFSVPGNVPGVFGATQPSRNLGKVRNKGYEVELNYKGNVNKLTYWVNAQVSYAANVVEYRDEASNINPLVAATGRPVGAQFAFTSLGFYKDIADVFNSPRLASANPLTNLFPGAIKLADLDKNGIIDQYDRGYLGINTPPYTAGFSFGISFKGFDFSTLFQGGFGNIINIQNGLIAYQRADRQSINYNLGRWTPGNTTNAVFPALAGGVTKDQASSYWYSKGDYVRWKNVELGYRFPKSIVKRLHLNNGRIYVNGYNMGLLYTALPVFIDPEAPSGVGVLYPQQRIINIGLQIGL